MTAQDHTKVVLITGTRKGIGRYLAQRYVTSGCRVVGCSRQPAEPLGPNYVHYCLDVADEQAVRQMFGDIRKREGRLDVLINNAGVASMNLAALTPLASARRVVETNFLGTFLFSREAAKLMMQQRSGRIINVSTVAVPLRLAGEAVYASSKAAVATFTQILARELGELGITVNAVAPTPVDTELLQGVPAEQIERLVNQQSIRRMGTFDDVANVIDFFVSPSSDFITGQVVYLGGVS